MSEENGASDYEAAALALRAGAGKFLDIVEAYAPEVDTRKLRNNLLRNGAGAGIGIAAGGLVTDTWDDHLRDAPLSSADREWLREYVIHAVAHHKPRGRPRGTSPYNLPPGSEGGKQVNLRFAPDVWQRIQDRGGARWVRQVVMAALED